MGLRITWVVFGMVLVSCGGTSDVDGGLDGAVMDADAPRDAGGDAAADAAADASRDAARDAGPLPLCAPGVGLSEPIPKCSAGDPCTDLLLTYSRLSPPVDRLDTPSDAPTCATSSFGTGRGYPAYTDDAPRMWMDADGVNRYWCEVRPSGTGVASPRPLLIYTTGSGGHAGTVYDATLLRDKQPDYDLSGDPARPGFVLASVQPRNLHWPTVDPQEGTKFDSQYRDLASPSTNPDIAFVDHIIDSLVDEGVVDPQRIYLMGWSNGGRFSVFYGIARHGTSTPGGNHVAAVANFSAGDPFGPPTVGDLDCQAAPYPTAALPYYLISRTCDAIACDAAQDSGLVPGNVVEPWVEVLRSEIGADVTWQRIDDNGVPRAACAIAGLCGTLRQITNHIRWPDGIADGSGRDHEPAMLDFLRDHPSG